MFLAGEDFIGQSEVWDVERVLEEIGQDVVVCDGGAAAGGDRGRRRGAEVDGGAVC